MNRTRIPGPLLGAAAVALLAGCGPTVGNVSGTVTLGDRPLAEGQLTFFGPDNQVTTTTINPDGTYRIDGMPAGNYKVVVLPPPTAPEAMQVLKVRGKEGKAAPVAPPKAKSPIPDRYADVTTSGLGTTIKAGENKYDVPLTP